MIEHWEKFKGGGTKPAAERRHITLSDKSVIAMNRTVYKLLGSPSAVAFYFNATEKRIGIEPCNSESDDAFRVIEKSSNYVIHASPFCRNHKIRLIGTEKFTDIELTESGMLRLGLTTTVKVSRGPRRKKDK